MGKPFAIALPIGGEVGRDAGDALIAAEAVAEAGDDLVEDED